MRVKLDENLPVQFKRLFEESGHHADTVIDEGMAGAADAEVMAACLAEDRILVTLDMDFADIRSYPPSEFPGIVVLRLANQARDRLLELGTALVDALARSSPSGQLWIVESTRVRIRK